MSLTISGRYPVATSVIQRIVKLIRTNHPAMPGEINIVFTTRRVLKRLNMRYRHHNKPTTILSFNLSESNSATGPVATGELYISMVEVRQEAKSTRQAVLIHLMHLLTHGLLHLAGLTHENNRNRQLMERKEKHLAKILTPNHPQIHVIH